MPATFQGTGYGGTKEAALDDFYQRIMRERGVERNRILIVTGREISPEDTFDRRCGYRGVYSLVNGTSSGNGTSAQSSDGTNGRARVGTRNFMRNGPGASSSLVERVKKFGNPFK